MRSGPSSWPLPSELSASFGDPLDLDGEACDIRFSDSGALLSSCLHAAASLPLGHNERTTRHDAIGAGSSGSGVRPQPIGSPPGSPAATLPEPAVPLRVPHAGSGAALQLRDASGEPWPPWPATSPAPSLGHRGEVSEGLTCEARRHGPHECATSPAVASSAPAPIRSLRKPELHEDIEAQPAAKPAGAPQPFAPEWWEVPPEELGIGLASADVFERVDDSSAGALLGSRNASTAAAGPLGQAFAAGVSAGRALTAVQTHGVGGQDGQSGAWFGSTPRAERRQPHPSAPSLALPTLRQQVDGSPQPTQPAGAGHASLRRATCPPASTANALHFVGTPQPQLLRAGREGVLPSGEAGPTAACGIALGHGPAQRSPPPDMGRSVPGLLSAHVAPRQEVLVPPSEGHQAARAEVELPHRTQKALRAAAKAVEALSVAAQAAMSARAGRGAAHEADFRHGREAGEAEAEAVALRRENAQLRQRLLDVQRAVSAAPATAAGRAQSCQGSARYPGSKTPPLQRPASPGHDGRAVAAASGVSGGHGARRCTAGDQAGSCGESAAGRHRARTPSPQRALRVGRASSSGSTCAACRPHCSATQGNSGRSRGARAARSRSEAMRGPKDRRSHRAVATPGHHGGNSTTYGVWRAHPD